MSEDPIEALLAGRLPDPDGGAALAVPVGAVLMAESLADDERDGIAALGLGRRLAVVSDPATHAALGARLERSLAGLGRIEAMMFPDAPHADIDTVALLRQATRRADALIAAGSGTINDLCKYAAMLDGKPYVACATAPSMNGYTSANAAITVNGHKQSLSAAAPVAVLLDLGVLAAAPPRLIRAGLGDSLCRPTAQTDWLLAHTLWNEPYREAPFTLLADDEPALFESSAGLLTGDLEAMGHLARTLVLSGFGMTICGGSMPASQGEHLIGHYMEMRPFPGAPANLHGEQIGVATLTMARLHETLFAGDVPILIGGDPSRDELIAHFGSGVGARCWEAFEPKRLTREKLDEANHRLAGRWSELTTRVAQAHLPVTALEAVLARAGAATTSAHIGWPRHHYYNAVRHAREIRHRYTGLDLAAQSRQLDGFLDGVVAKPAFAFR